MKTTLILTKSGASGITGARFSKKIMDSAQQWGLPPNFTPVRYAISDAAKAAVRPFLQANEPVVVSLGNEGDTIAIVGTPQRLLVIKTSTLGGGAAGAAVKEFPWEGLRDIVSRPQTLNLTLALHYNSNDGRRVEVGKRARLAKDAVDNLMAFELVAGQEVFVALLQISNWKKAQIQAQE